jgi:hypothetical protein
MILNHLPLHSFAEHVLQRCNVPVNCCRFVTSVNFLCLVLFYGHCCEVPQGQIAEILGQSIDKVFFALERPLTFTPFPVMFSELIEGKRAYFLDTWRLFAFPNQLFSLEK